MMRLTFMVLTILLSLTGTLLAFSGKAQDMDKPNISVNLKKARLGDVLDELEKQSGFSFTYPSKMGAINPVSLLVKEQSLRQVLQTLAQVQRLKFTQINQMISISVLPPPVAPGKIAGKVLDEKGLVLPGATIKVVETGQGIQSNVDGTYQISLPPGTYTLEVSYISYQTKRITGIIVTEGKNTPLDIAMTLANSMLGQVVITGDYKKSSIEGLYAKQKNNTAITDGISAEQIARTPDKNIGETLKRISGVSVLENKYVVVRGLGERYNGTMMNGQVMPSTELNRKQFSFDIIPANMVDNITIYKTINPDKSAEFGGGLIEVNTKSIPTENSLSITFGESYNDKTTGKNFTNQYIGTRSYFGSATSDRTLFGRTDWKSSADIRAYYTANNSSPKLFSNNWKLYNYTPSVSPNFQASLARVINLKNNDQIGFIASASYRNTWQTSDVLSGRNGYVADPEKEELYGFTGKRYGFTTNIGGIIGAGYTGQQFKASVQSIYLRTFDQQLLFGTGVKEDYGQAIGYFDQTTQTNLWQNQLKGEKKIGSHGIKLEGLLSYAVIDRQKPDNHQLDAFYIGSVTDGPNVAGSDFSIISPRSNLDKGVLRSWSRSFEKNLGWNLDLTVPVKFDVLKIPVNNAFKTGYSGWSKDRLFWVVNTGSNYNATAADPQPLSEVFDQNLHPGGTIEINRFGDDYQHKATQHAGYVMLDSKIGSKLRLTGGVRGEYYDLNSVNTVLDRFVKAQIDQNNDVTDYSDLYGKEPKFNLFPSAALTYGLTKKMNLRLSYAKSIIRPDLRELSFFQEYDFELGGIYQSQSPIRSTKIDNLDFRYEWYPNAGDILSVSLFYKKLLHPMEIYDLGNRIYELRNDLSAKNKGIELEARKSFAFTGLPVLRNLTLYGNFTRLFAKVTPMKVAYNSNFPGHEGKMLVVDVALPEVNRPQAGASNYTYNAGIYYDSKPVSLSLSYNYVTNRVFRASEVYKESLFETPLPSMDGQLAVNILKNKGQVKMNISNILNRSSQVYEKRQGDQSTTLFYEKGDFINYQASPGRTYGLSFNYNF